MTAGPAGWLYGAAALWIVALLLVPWKRFVRLLPLGIVGGFLLSLGIQLVGVSLLGLWRFGNPLLPLMGVPLPLPLSYLAEVVIFANFLPRTPARIAYYAVGFSLLNVVVDFLLLTFGYQFHPAWNLAGTFGVALFSHAVVVYLYLAMNMRQRLEA